MSDSPNPASENASAEPRDPEGIDAAAAAFASMDRGTDQPEDEAEPDRETDGEADTEADAADPEADEPEDELAEVEFNGHKISAPKEVADELQKSLLRQADYSRKMNEVASLEKQYTERLKSVEVISESTEKYAEALARVRSIEAQLGQVDAVDWAALEAESPQDASRLAVRQLRLQQELNKAAAEAQSVGENAAQERQKLLASQREEMFAVLGKSIKGWGADLGQKLTEYAVKNGVSFQTLSETTDPGVVLALDKARRYDELQASKTAIKAKAQGAPQVVKPGSPRKTDPKSDAMSRLRKSNSLDDAAAAFLARGR